MMRDKKNKKNEVGSFIEWVPLGVGKAELSADAITIGRTLEALGQRANGLNFLLHVLQDNLAFRVDINLPASHLNMALLEMIRDGRDDGRVDVADPGFLPLGKQDLGGPVAQGQVVFELPIVADDGHADYGKGAAPRREHSGNRKLIAI